MENNSLREFIRKNEEVWERAKYNTVRDSTLEKRIKNLYKKYAKVIVGILGVHKISIPPISIIVLKTSPYLAAVEGNIVFVNQEDFSKTEDDGVFIHEFVHIIMHPIISNDETFWIAEGIADYVRNKLGFRTALCGEYYKKGQALEGYQTSAHFLMYLERFRPTIIKELYRAIGGSLWDFAHTIEFDSTIFIRLFGKPLSGLVEQYEKEYDKYSPA